MRPAPWSARSRKGTSDVGAGGSPRRRGASARAPRRASAEVVPLSRPEPEGAASLHVLTCGSVDDGKSTLIGRMLWDAGALHSDQQQALEKWPRTAAGTPDFSRLMDGLAAEREQGITIDVAWRYFDARRPPARHHRQSGSRAVHAQHGDRRLARRRGDPAGRCARRHQGADATARGDPRPDGRRPRRPCRQQDGPGGLVAAALSRDRGRVHGAGRSLPLPRCGGDPGLGGAGRQRRAPLGRDALVSGPGAARPPAAGAGATCASGDAFRFPVQIVVRDGHDFRGLAGTVASGEIGVGTRWSMPSAAGAPACGAS